MGTLEQAASKWWRALTSERAQGAAQEAGAMPQDAPGPISCSSENRPQVTFVRSGTWRAGPRAQVLCFTAQCLWLRIDKPMPRLRLERRLKLKLDWPEGAGQHRVTARGEITRASHTAHKTELEITLLRPSAVLLSQLAQYALCFGEAEGVALTPAELRRRHFGPMDASPCLRFGSLESPHEMAAIKQLRFDVFRQSALLKPSQTHPDDTADERDKNSHILTAYWHKQLVATCRVYAMELHDSYEFDAWAQGTACLPPKDACVELGRAAIDPSFRNAGIPLQLFRMITAHTMASGRRYMVLGTQPSLVPFYRCFGFQVTPIRFPFPGRTDFLAHVLVADLHALWRGEEGNPLVWYALFGSLPKDCARGFYAPRSTQEKVRVEVLRSLGLVSRSVNHCLSWQSRWRHLMRP